MKQLIQNLIRQRGLLSQFTYREVIGRYKGSYFGIVWTIIQPLVMLLIYSFVFSVIFKAKWGNSTSVSNLDFAMVTFGGLIVFQIFSEPMYRSSTLLTSNSNFVKRVVFPLEILPTAAVLSSFILNAISIVILVLALLSFGYPIGWHILLMPLVLVPLLIFTAGFSYLVSTLGVFFRDLGQAMGIFMNILFYISPVFYPISAVPPKYQIFMYFNPFSIFIENFRAVTIYNQMPEWNKLAIIYLISTAVFILGAFVFTNSKETFSDAI